MIIDDKILMEVEKPSRYTGGELNSVVKEHADCDVSFAFCFPDTYEVGMSHIGLKILYHIINERSDSVCERVFAPWIDMEEKMRKNGIPLFSLETKKPLKEFDVAGFTLQYEMSYTNILNMLDLGGIPVLASERDDTYPLVCAGGPCAVNPEPLADVIDFFVIGEGEDVINEVLDAVINKKRKGTSKSDFLKILSEIEGIYVPSLYEVEYNNDGTIKKPVPVKVRRRIIKDLDKAKYPDKIIVPYINIVHDRIMLEVFRGCIRGCRFCQAGYIYRPVRERSADTLVKSACDLLESTGYEEISLSSLSTSDYTELKDLTERLIEITDPKKVSLALPSLRADNFSFELMKKVQEVRKSGLTFAPEAGTQRLRDVINKNITEDDILNSVETAFEGGWNTIKLYFMLGLPDEKEEDVAGIVDLVYKILDKGRRRVNITVSTSFFVPKPFTPFQWEPQDNKEQMVTKQRMLSARLKNRKISYNWHDFNTSRLEAVMSRGDRRVGKVIVSAWEKGCKFDGWADQFKYDSWIEAFNENGLDPDFYTSRIRDKDEIFPWDHIDTGVSKAFLYSENVKAKSGDTTPDCRSKCSGCGIMMFKGGEYSDCCKD